MAITQKQLIDYCNSRNGVCADKDGIIVCPCEIQCDVFWMKCGTSPYMEDTWHNGEHYTDEVVMK